MAYAIQRISDKVVLNLYTLPYVMDGNIITDVQYTPDQIKLDPEVQLIEVDNTVQVGDVISSPVIVTTA